MRTQRNGGFDDSTIRDVVRGQIAYAEEPMPQNLYEGQQADDISAYVAKCAGVRSCGVQAAGGGGGGGGTTATPTTQTETSTSGGGRGGAGSKVAEGKKIFTGTAGCSSCHTLKDANATGTIGPNLDEKKPAKALAVERVTNGKSPMPSFKGQLTPAQIDAVATYVSSVAGK